MKLGETFASNEVAVPVESRDIAVVRVIRVEPSLCFCVGGEITAIL